MRLLLSLALVFTASSGFAAAGGLMVDGKVVAFPAKQVGAMRVSAGAGAVSVENGRARFRLVAGGREEFSAWKAGWRLMAVSAPEANSASPLNLRNARATEVELVSLTAAKAVLELKTLSTPRQTTRVELGAGDRFFRIERRIDLAAETKAESFWSAYLFGPGGRRYADYKPLDLVWTPLLRPLEGQVIGEHIFRSPAIVLQKGSDAAILIPDLDTIAANTHRMRTCLDLEVNDSSGAPRLGFGLMESQVQTHVSYRHDAGMLKTLAPGSVSWGYFLYLDANMPARQAHRVVARFAWERWGSRFMDDTRPQAAPFMRYTRAGFEDYCFKYLWKDVEIDGKPAGGSVTGAFGGKDIWFQGWFNNLRTAYGLNLWGKRLGDEEWVAKSERVKELILSAPQKEGIFPTLFDTNAKQWIGSCGRGSAQSDYHTLDCSWTAYWLLRWEQDVEKDARIELFCRRYAEFLVTHQLPSGAIPSWYDESLKPRETFRECAETTASALFLAELYRVTHDSKYLQAAKKGADFITREVLPEHKWFDFETYFSCSPKPLDFYDTHTQQHPQNNLSIHWAAETYKTLYMATGNKSYLRLGESVLDYLVLYQQVWAPPFLSVYGFGGFGVQNTDGEWHDARQAVFATTLADFYELTGRPEYLERAIAAVRASFVCEYLHENQVVSPRTFSKTPIGNADENYGHGGGDAPAGPSSFDWGPGSGAAGAIYLIERYGQAFVDLAWKRGFGIDGCTVENLSIRGDKIGFELVSDLATPAPVQVRFRGLSRESAEVGIAGAWRRYSRKELERGIIAVPVARGLLHVSSGRFAPKEPWKLFVASRRAPASARMALRYRPVGSDRPYAKLAMTRVADSSCLEVEIPKPKRLPEELLLQYYFEQTSGARVETVPSPYAEAAPFRVRISEAMVADCGDDDERYLTDADGSQISDWSGGGENDRYADYSAHFTYRFPIAAGTRSVDVQFLENGSGRVKIGDFVLLEEKDEGQGEIRLFHYTLTDPSLWVDGKLSLRFEPVNPQAGWGPNVAWIRVKS